MEHLNLEALARLVDEAPSREERHHLEECGRCRTELDLLCGQSRALGGLPDMRPPKGDWAVLEARLMSEGLLRHERSFLASTPGWMKAAATVLLFLGGTGLGMALGDGGGAGPLARDAAGESPYTMVSQTASTLDEAQEVVLLKEREYRDALIRYRQLLDAEQGADGGAFLEEKLAGMEYVVRAAQAAVEQAPADPFLNGLLASALAERQATYQAALRQGTGEGWH